MTGGKMITKRDGSSILFDPAILFDSLVRAGAIDDTAERITRDIYESLQPEDKSDDIYKMAFDMLGSHDQESAMRYSLKRALFSFGPTGFPFEKFVGQLFTKLGYTMRNGLIIQGACVSHEVDVYATKGGEAIAMELKFHNDVGGRTDVKTALYVKSRFDDLLKPTQKGSLLGKYMRPFKSDEAANAQAGMRLPVTRGVLITNTKFTSQAIQYAECAGVELLGWGYPHNYNLRHMIEEVNAHPITCLPSLKKGDMRIFFDKGITTCQQFAENIDHVKSWGIANGDVLIKEAQILCKPENRIMEN